MIFMQPIKIIKAMVYNMLTTTASKLFTSESGMWSQAASEWV